jgi:tRNA(His) 5'-end guanylyltransferase
MKDYERRETARKFLPLAPVYARIDGRCFSAFTRGMERPYDVRLTRCLIETTKHLVKETGALIGFCQSDEISLVWQMPDTKTEMLFDGKVFKLTSLLASMATAKFMSAALAHWPEKVMRQLPTFDARVFELPNREEATNAILWRERDATKNAISMAARSVYSATALHRKSGREMQEMLFQKGINFNDYPSFFKRGTFVQRRRVLKPLTDEILAKIPEAHRPTGPIDRWEILELEMPSFTTVINRVAVVFEGADPVTAAANEAA